ncbi:helix-turn-helix domain-containing protein [Carnobacterium maltaromaticum]|uniref:helix-turn-helix domain-containing protein n=1 Tax=Carnobacterium maltaromaticum TaxID=2751 RepID=UPI0039AFD482
MAGLEAAKLNGKSLGRHPLVEKNQLALQLYYENRFSVKEIATISGLATSTVYKIIKQEKEKPKN